MLALIDGDIVADRATGTGGKVQPRGVGAGFERQRTGGPPGGIDGDGDPVADRDVVGSRWKRRSGRAAATRCTPSCGQTPVAVGDGESRGGRCVRAPGRQHDQRQQNEGRIAPRGRKSESVHRRWQATAHGFHFQSLEHLKSRRWRHGESSQAYIESTFDVERTRIGRIRACPGVRQVAGRRLQDVHGRAAVDEVDRRDAIDGNGEAGKCGRGGYE